MLDLIKQSGGSIKKFSGFIQVKDMPSIEELKSILDYYSDNGNTRIAFCEKIRELTRRSLLTESSDRNFVPVHVTMVDLEEHLRPLLETVVFTSKLDKLDIDYIDAVVKTWSLGHGVLVFTTLSHEEITAIVPAVSQISHIIFNS